MRRRNSVLLQRQPGVTMLELIVAVLVSTIVITLSLTVFSGILRQFMSQTNLARTAGEMIVAKKRIDACLSDIVSIKECTERSITCAKADIDTFVTIRFVKDSLFVGSSVVCGNVKDFSFTLMEKDQTGPWVLLWEGRLKKSDWFGGAVSGGR